MVAVTAGIEIGAGAWHIVSIFLKDIYIKKWVKRFGLVRYYLPPRPALPMVPVFSPLILFNFGEAASFWNIINNLFMFMVRLCSTMLFYQLKYYFLQ